MSRVPKWLPCPPRKRPQVVSAGVRRRTASALLAGSLAAIIMALPLQGAAQEGVRLAVAGVIYPIEERELAFSTSGLIEHSGVSEGDAVEQGQQLIELENQLNVLEIERRRLLLDDTTAIETLSRRNQILNAQYRSLQQLFDDTGSVSRDELIALELQVLETRGQLESARFQKQIEETEWQIETARLEQTRLYSPISGVVTEIIRQPGEWASVGEPILRVVDMREVVLRISVADTQARGLEVGQTLMVSVDELGVRQGSIKRIASVADPASSRVWVHIVIDNADQDIIPGTRASVQL